MVATRLGLDVNAPLDPARLGPAADGRDAHGDTHGEAHGGTDLGAVPAAPQAAEPAPPWRSIWSSRFGEMLIEVRDGTVYVNGDVVRPAAAAPDPGSRGSTPGGA